MKYIAFLIEKLRYILESIYKHLDLKVKQKVADYMLDHESN